MTFASGATYTATFDLYLVSTALGGFNGQDLYLPSVASDGTGTNACKLQWFNDGSTLKLQGVGSTTSANTATVSTGSWHTIKLHCASGASASYISLDGVQQTFTQNAAATNFQNVGDLDQQGESIVYFIGYLIVDNT